jgi:hypothetical protein
MDVTQHYASNKPRQSRMQGKIFDLNPKRPTDEAVTSPPPLSLVRKSDKEGALGS